MGNPLIRTAHWGEMRESNSRDWSHNPVPKPFGQSRHRKSGAGRVNRTLVGEVQALCTPTVLDLQTLELARSLELRSGAYHALPFPLSYTSGAGAAIRTPITDLRGPGSSRRATPASETLEAEGRIALPRVCFAGRFKTELLGIDGRCGVRCSQR